MVVKKKASKTAEARKNTFDDAGAKTVVVTQSATVPAAFKIKRTITVPSLAIKNVGQGYALKFDSAMRVSTISQKAGTGKDGQTKQMEPATIANVTDVQTGEQYIYLVATVVKSNLENNYADESYVGKVFWICNKGKRKESQRYSDFEIQEIEAS